MTWSSLKRRCDVKWRVFGTFGMNMKERDSYLSSSTKIQRVGAFIAKIWSPPPLYKKYLRQMRAKVGWGVLTLKRVIWMSGGQEPPFYAPQPLH